MRQRTTWIDASGLSCGLVGEWGAHANHERPPPSGGRRTVLQPNDRSGRHGPVARPRVRWHPADRHRGRRARRRQVSAARALADRAQRRGFRVLRANGYYETPPLLPVLTAMAPLIDQARQGRRTDLTDEDIEALNVLSESSGPVSASSGGIGCPTTRIATSPRRACCSARLDHVRSCSRSTMPTRWTTPAQRCSHISPRPRCIRLKGCPCGCSRNSRFDPAQVDRWHGAPLLAFATSKVVPNSAPRPRRGRFERFARSFGPAAPSRPLLRSMRRRTDGNPLFARLLWTHLLDSGAAVKEGDQVVLGDPAAAEMASLGLDDVVDERVDALRQACRDLLAVAAVLGTEGDIDVLATTTDRSREQTEDLLLRSRPSRRVPHRARPLPVRSSAARRGPRSHVLEPATAPPAPPSGDRDDPTGPTTGARHRQPSALGRRPRAGRRSTAVGSGCRRASNGAGCVG